MLDDRCAAAVDAFVRDVEARCTDDSCNLEYTECAPDHPIHLMGQLACPVKLRGYVVRFARHALLTPEDLAYAIVYFESLTARMAIGSRSVHRAVAAVLICAHKFNHDLCLNSRSLAKVAGVSCRELLRVETCVLLRLEWRLSASATEVNARLERWGCIRDPGIGEAAYRQNDENATPGDVPLPEL